MKLQPILDRLSSLPALKFKDIRLTLAQEHSLISQLKISIVKILIKHSSPFSHYSTHPDLQYHPRRPMPSDYRTKVYPTRVTTFDESTIKGNNHFLNDLYRNQLGHEPADFNDRAIPWQLGYSPFHLQMNLDWLLLNVHRGKASETASLTWWFSILNKVRLGGQKPDYHTLLEAFSQILDGIILHGWRIECGHSSLESFAASKPSSQDLVEIARKVLNKCTDPIDSSSPNPINVAFMNTKRLTTHLLFVRMLHVAIQDGNFGRVEDLQGHLAMMFCAGGGKNYCSELLHFIQHLKYVWPEEFA
jgi:hypothetical protein